MNIQQKLQALKQKSGPMPDRRTKRLRDRSSRKREAIRRSRKGD